MSETTSLVDPAFPLGLRGAAMRSGVGVAAMTR